MHFEEIKLSAKQLSSLYNFYKDVLELPVKYVSNKNIVIDVGRSKLIFENFDDEPGAFYHFAFNIPSNKFEEAFTWLQNKVELLWLDDYKSYVADFVNWHAKSVYFLDPAGNILELIARFDLKDLADETFSSNQFRNISEIGLVSSNENFDGFACSLIDKYQLKYFSKQPPLPHFRAIGNDEGLFIIVPENRNWFSTNKPSGIFRLEVVFENELTSHRLKI